MAFKLAGKDLSRYLAGLETHLVRKARAMRGMTGDPQGWTAQDIAQQVAMEVTAFLVADVPLPTGRNRREVTVASVQELSQWAERRLRTVLDRVRKARRRANDFADYYASEVLAEGLMSAPSADEHPIYDSRFLQQFFDSVRHDHTAHQVALLVSASQGLPWSRDIDVCDNSLIAEALGFKPEDVINARRRIDTIKNRLLDERANEDPDGKPDPEEDD